LQERIEMSDNPAIIDNTAENRLEIDVGHARAELVYRAVRGRLVIVHTGVPDELAGSGLGGKLVAAAVEKAIAEGLTVVPSCAFAASWLRKHPDVATKVPIDWSQKR